MWRIPRGGVYTLVILLWSIWKQGNTRVLGKIRRQYVPKKQKKKKEGNVMLGN
jgi:hypothetical protein